MAKKPRLRYKKNKKGKQGEKIKILNVVKVLI